MLDPPEPEFFPKELKIDLWRFPSSKDRLTLTKRTSCEGSLESCSNMWTGRGALQ